MKVKTDLIQLTKENIYHLFPKILAVEVDVKRLADRCYRSKITLRTKSRIFSVGKEAQSYKKSLEKSYQAIKKQLEKVKVNKIHTRNPKVLFSDEIDRDFYTEFGGEG